MSARRLVALVLLVSTFGLAELSAGHGHELPAPGQASMEATGRTPDAASEATRCPVCPGVSTWRAGAAPAAMPLARVLPAPRRGLHRPAPPRCSARLAAAPRGPRAPPLSG